MGDAISFQNVSFSYPHTPVLQEASFSIEEGSFVGMIGPNGGGKTTLLQLILGFLQPEKGSIRVFGEAPPVRFTTIGYVPQSLRFDRLFPINLLDLVLMGRLRHLPWYGVFRAQERLLAEEAPSKVGLLDYKDIPFGNLSGGQMQRALIARAIVSQPALLLLDEPCANVDTEVQVNIYELLEGLKGKMTILMVTHDLNRAIQSVEKVFIVHHTVAAVDPKTVCNHFALGLYHG